MYQRISIHALLAESDITIDGHALAITSFLSTLSLRRATSTVDSCSCCSSNFYPRSPCGERRLPFCLSHAYRSISIHALLAESDKIPHQLQSRSRISIPALLAESDVSFMLYDTSSLIFLSTLSLRRATLNCSRNGFAMRYFYPRSPCGERRVNEDRYGQQF